MPCVSATMPCKSIHTTKPLTHLVMLQAQTKPDWFDGDCEEQFKVLPQRINYEAIQ